MMTSTQKIAKAYRSAAFNSFDYHSNQKYALPRGASPVSESFPKEKSFQELLKKELERAVYK